MRILTPLLITALFALPAAAEPKAQLDSEEGKVIYSMGVLMGQNLMALDFTEEEVELLLRGMRDQILDHELSVDFAEYGPKINDVAAARQARVAELESGASKAFLAEAAAAPGAVKMESGLIYTETKAGTGPHPASTDQVTVHYLGTLRDGTVFDDSRERGKPLTFPLNRVIACWTEALQLMQVGGQAKIICPAEIAYGDRGFGKIKPGATLRFELELISIQ